MRLHTPGLLAFALLATLQTAGGQEDADLVRRLARQARARDLEQRFLIPEGQALGERLFFDYGVLTRFSILGVDDRGGNTRVLRQTDTSAFASLEFAGSRFFAQLRLTYNDFNGGDSFDGDGDELEEPIAKLYWYAYDYRRGSLADGEESPNFNVKVRVGRQRVHWGSGLALSRVLYAGTIDLELFGLGLTGLAARTPTSGTVDLDPSRPSFDTNTQRNFVGAQLAYRPLSYFKPYVSALIQRDKNERDFSINVGRLNAFPTAYRYDSEYFAVGARGSLGPRLLYRAELIHERGRNLSNSFGPQFTPITQSRDDIEAWAGIVTVSYLLGDSWSSRLDLEALAGSGDDDRLEALQTFAGNRVNTEDRSFNALGFANTGLALAPEVANLFSTQLGFSVSPPLSADDPNALRLGIQSFLFLKVNEQAPLNIATDDHRVIGGEFDLNVDWRVTSDLSVTARYGIFLPGDAIVSSENGERHFGFMGVSFAY